MATSDEFTVYAYATPAGKSFHLRTFIDGTNFYLAIALTPNITTGVDYGSFTVNGGDLHQSDGMT